MRVWWATKGLEAETDVCYRTWAREALAIKFRWRLSLANVCERTGGRFTDGHSLASTDQTFADDLQQLLHCGKSFRVSATRISSVQLGGAVKNVIAIGGMSDGIGFGANARTALITRGLAEMSRWRGAGADPATFMGMAGWAIWC